MTEQPTPTPPRGWAAPGIALGGVLFALVNRPGGLAVIGVVALLVWLGTQVVEHRARRTDRRATWALVGLAIAAFGLNVGPTIPGALTGTHIRAWNQFHYYLGAKYFEEVGWHDLYTSVLHADERFQERKAAASPEEREALDAIQDFSHAQQIRSMRTYSIGPRDEALATFDASAWSDERLAELGEDARWFRTRGTDAVQAGKTHDNWSRRMVLDFGFNPAPPWLLLGSTVANAVPLGSKAYPLITSSDLFVHLLAIFAMTWGFGLRAGALAAIWIHTMPINGRLVVGGFLNYDWLGTTLLGVAAYRKERPVLAALSLAYAGMTRVFPGVLILPIVGRWAYNVVRRRPTVPLRRTFSTVFIAACAVLFVASHFTGRGADTWLEWEDKISAHSDHHATSGARRVGLGKLVRHQPRGERFWRAPGRQGDEREAGIRTKKHVGLVLGFALLLAALRRRTDHEAMLLMLFAVWLIAVSSRYYASVWALLFTLPTLVGGKRSVPGTLAAGALLVMTVVFYAPANSTGQYLLLNYEAVAMFVALCVAFLWTDRAPAPGDVTPAR